MQRRLCWGIYSGNGRNITGSTLSVGFYFLAIWTRFFCRFYHKRWECIGDGALQKRVHGEDKNWRLKNEQKGTKNTRGERERKKYQCVAASAPWTAPFINTLLHTREISKACSGTFFLVFSKTNKQPSDKRSNHIIPLDNSSVPALPPP